MLEQGKAERKEASLIAFQENLHLVFKDNCDSFENVSTYFHNIMYIYNLVI